MSMRDEFIRGLEILGCQRVEGRSRKYVVLRSSKNPHLLYYVGKAGALRVGRSLATSRPASDDLKTTLRCLRI